MTLTIKSLPTLPALIEAVPHTYSFRSGTYIRQVRIWCRCRSTHILKRREPYHDFRATHSGQLAQLIANGLIL